MPGKSPDLFSPKVYLGFTALLLLVYRYILLKYFGWVYSDSDQSIMWLATTHYSEGLFYEPRFYGQSYNTMLEALLAVPFYLLGMAPYKALPLISSLLSILPYFILSWLCYKKHRFTAALIVLSIPLLLPFQFDFITNLSRGFVTGIAILSLGFFTIFRVRNFSSHFILSLLAVIAFSVNPNSLILSCFMLLYFLLINYKRIYFYVYGTLGFISGIMIHLLIQYFYIKNPEYALHDYKMVFSTENFLKGIKEIHNYFEAVSPFFLPSLWWIPALVFILGIAHYRRGRYAMAICTFSIPLLLVLPLFVSKVHDGSAFVFMPLARMYLSIPLIFACSFSLLKLNSKTLNISLLSTMIIFFSYKTYSLSGEVNREIKRENDGVVAVMETRQLRADCGHISEIAKKHEVELIIYSAHWYQDFFNYGCLALNEDHPLTLRPAYERRVWQLKQHAFKVYSNIILVDVMRDLAAEYEFIESIEEKQGFYLIKGNTLPTVELLSTLNLPVRNFK